MFDIIFIVVSYFIHFCYNFYGLHVLLTERFNRFTILEIPVLPDADENIDAELLQSVKPAELHTRMLVYISNHKPSRGNDIQNFIIFQDGIGI